MPILHFFVKRLGFCEIMKSDFSVRKLHTVMLTTLQSATAMACDWVKIFYAVVAFFYIRIGIKTERRLIFNVN